MKYILLLAFLLPACDIPSEEEVKNDCQQIVDQATEDSWAACTSYFEVTIAPQFKALVDQLKEYIDQTCSPATPGLNQ